MIDLCSNVSHGPGPETGDIIYYANHFLSASNRISGDFLPLTITVCDNQQRHDPWDHEETPWSMRSWGSWREGWTLKVCCVSQIQKTLGVFVTLYCNLRLFCPCFYLSPDSSRGLVRLLISQFSFTFLAPDWCRAIEVYISKRLFLLFSLSKEAAFQCL